MKTHYNELLKHWYMYIETMDSILICSKYKKKYAYSVWKCFQRKCWHEIYVIQYQLSNLNVAKNVTGIVAAVIWVTCCNFCQSDNKILPVLYLSFLEQNTTNFFTSSFLFTNIFHCNGSTSVTVYLLCKFCYFGSVVSTRTVHGGLDIGYWFIDSWGALCSCPGWSCQHYQNSASELFHFNQNKCLPQNSIFIYWYLFFIYL